MPTTGHGLVYPDSSGNTQIWTHVQNLADSVETALDAYETWTSWTPTWDTSGGGGFTSVGAGQNQGFYQRFGTGTGSLVHAEFRVELGAGFSTDTGTFVLILPVAAYIWAGSVVQGTIGNYTIRDDSVPYHYSGSLGLWSSSADRVSFNGSWDGTKPRSRVDSNDPVVWASGDILSGTLSYRSA